MNHRLAYDRLIANRLNDRPDGYVEKHHILPRSLGGSDDPSNIVALTAREHYIAHLLLHKIYGRSETAFALWMMQCRTEEGSKRIIKSSRMYQWAREQFVKFAKEVDRTGDKNSQFGTRWICNIDLKENRKISKDVAIPDGWQAGRNKWIITPKRAVNNPGRVKLKEFIRITDGKSNKMLCWEDQQIPAGWHRGSTPMKESSKKKLKCFWAGKKRPYRVGLKHNIGNAV
jgi:hypothetical protein